MTGEAETTGLPINEAVAFADKKGEFKERIRKKQVEMLQDHAALLKQFLEPGEEILLATRGCSPVSWLEQLTTGWIVFRLKRCTLVVTNRRILHFPSKGNFKPRHSISQIRFGDVEEIKSSSFFGRFTVRYKEGKKEVFNYVKEVAKFKATLSGLKFQGQPATAARGRHHLCPRCTAPLEAGVYTCKACSLEFKNEKKSKLLSILIPGGGYFYTNHSLLGVQDFLVESFLIVLTASSAIDMVKNGAADQTFVFFFFGVILVLEKIYTVYHAQHYVREYIPVNTEFAPFKTAKSD